MRFDFTKERRSTAKKAISGDVRIRQTKQSYLIEFGNSAIAKLGINVNSRMRFAFNEIEDEAGRTFEADRYIGFEFYDYDAMYSRKVRKSSGGFYVMVNGKEDCMRLKRFLRGSDSKEFKLFKDSYSEEKQFVIDSHTEWNEEKGAVLSLKYRRNK